MVGMALHVFSIGALFFFNDDETLGAESAALLGDAEEVEIFAFSSIKYRCVLLIFFFFSVAWTRLMRTLKLNVGWPLQRAQEISGSAGSM